MDLIGEALKAAPGPLLGFVFLLVIAVAHEYRLKAIETLNARDRLEILTAIRHLEIKVDRLIGR